MPRALATFAWLVQARTLATDYERTVASSEAWVKWRAVYIMSRRLRPTCEANVCHAPPLGSPRKTSRIGSQPQPIALTGDERDKLADGCRRPTTQQRLAIRGRIVLAAAEGQSYTAIAADLRITLPTVRKWQDRFAASRLDGLTDEPRPGAPRTVTDTQGEAALARTLEPQPTDATHWSTRALARELNLSQTAVSRIWRAFALKPHLRETFKLPTDPFFTAEVRDVVGLYMAPPERAVVLCVDEKAQVQARDRTPPTQPMLVGRAEKATHDYVWHSTTSRFSGLGVATGAVVGKCYRRHRHQECVAFLDHLDTTRAR